MFWNEESEEYMCESCWEENGDHCDARSGSGEDDEHEMSEEYILSTAALKHREPPTLMHGAYDNTPRCFYRVEESEPVVARYYGMEIEVDIPDDCDPWGRERRDNIVEDVLGRILNHGENEAWNYWMAKSDGSLRCGFELISQPMTLAYMKQAGFFGKLEEAMKFLIKNKYRSHDTSTCGLHFHVSKNSMSCETIAKLLMLVNKFWNTTFRVSRRKENRLSQWGKRPMAIESEGDFARTVSIAKKTSRWNDRYVAINLTKVGTVEFRACRGTMKVSSIIACLHYFDFLITCAEAHTRYQIWSMAPSEFLEKMECYSPELKAYMEERGINEETCSC